MHECVGEQLADRNLGEPREPEAEQADVDLVLGVVRRDQSGDLFHRTDKWPSFDPVDAYCQVFENLETDLVG